MKKLADLLKKPDCCRCREKGIAFLEKRLPQAPDVKILLDAMKENFSLPGAVIQVLNGMTTGLLLLWFAALAFLLLLNVFVRPLHPHFGADAYWGFWAVFGLGIGCIMVFVMKRVIQPLIVRKEDYYGDI